MNNFFYFYFFFSHALRVIKVQLIGYVLLAPRITAIVAIIVHLMLVHPATQISIKKKQYNPF